MAGESVHHVRNAENVTGNHQRRTFESIAVVGGIYATYKMVQQFRTNQQAPTRVSSPSTSLWWSAVMVLLYRALRTADESVPVHCWPHQVLGSTPRTGHRCRETPRQSFLRSSQPVAETAKGTTSPASAPKPSEHTQWLESFRTEQVLRLRTDPPTD
jgi:hypothetical protein